MSQSLPDSNIMKHIKDSYSFQNKSRQFLETEMYKTLDRKDTQNIQKQKLIEIFMNKNKIKKKIEIYYEMYKIGKDIEKKDYIGNNIDIRENTNTKLENLGKKIENLGDSFPYFFRKYEQKKQKTPEIKYNYIVETINTHVKQTLSNLNYDKTLESDTRGNIENIKNILSLENNEKKEGGIDNTIINETIQEHDDIGELANESMKTELTKKLRMYAFIDGCINEEKYKEKDTPGHKFNIGHKDIFENLYTPNVGINMPNETLPESLQNDYQYYSYIDGEGWIDTITNEKKHESEILSDLKQIWVPSIQFNKLNHDKMLEYSNKNNDEEGIDIEFETEDYVWISEWKGKNLGIPIRKPKEGKLKGKYNGEKKTSKGGMIFYKIVLNGEGIATDDRRNCREMKEISLGVFITAYHKIIKKYDSLVRIMVNTIRNFEDIIINHDENEDNYYIFNSIKIEKFEYNRIKSIIEELKELVKDKQELGTKNSTNWLPKGSEIYQREMKNLKLFLKKYKSGNNNRFEPSTMRRDRRRRGRFPNRRNDNNNNNNNYIDGGRLERVDEDDEDEDAMNYEDRRQQNVNRNEEALDAIMNMVYDDRENYSSTQREFNRDENQDNFEIDYGLVLVKFIGAVAIPLILSYLTYTTLFPRFNPISMTESNHEILYAIYPNVSYFENMIVNLCLNTNYEFTEHCVKMTIPEQIISHDDFKTMMIASMGTFISENVVETAQSALKYSLTQEFGPQSLKSIKTLFSEFQDTLKTNNNPGDVQIAFNDKYNALSKKILRSGIIRKMREKSMASFVINNKHPQDQPGALPHSADKMEITARVRKAFTFKLYDSILSLSELVLNMWAYKSLYDVAIITLSLGNTFNVFDKYRPRISKNVLNYGLFSGGLGLSWFIPQILNKFQTIMFENEADAATYLSLGIFSIQSVTVYFWLQIFEGYINRGIPKAKLKKGKIYEYIDKISIFDTISSSSISENIKSVMRAVGGHVVPKHRVFMQIKYTQANFAEYICTQMPNRPRRFLEYSLEDSNIANKFNLREILYSPGQYVRIRHRGSWYFGIVVDDLGNLWKSDTDNTLGKDIPLVAMEESRILDEHMKERFFSNFDIKLPVNNRLVMFKNKDTTEVQFSTVPVSYESIGDNFRLLLNARMIYGALLYMFSTNTFDGQLLKSLSDFLLLMLSGKSPVTFFSGALAELYLKQMNIPPLWAEQGFLASSMYFDKNRPIFLNRLETSNETTSRIILLLCLEMEIAQDENGNYYINKGFFWNPTTASITRISETSQPVIFMSVNQNGIAYDNRPKIDYFDGKIRIHFARANNQYPSHVFYRYIVDQNDKVLPHYHSWYYYEVGGMDIGNQAHV